MQILLIIGLVAAMLMYSGDMFLYYNKEESKSDGSYQHIINIMKKIGDKRLYLGGIIGSVASFIYCVAYYHTAMFIVDEKFLLIGWICFLVNSLGIICGGAYHTHFAYLGLIGKLDNQDAMNVVLKYMNLQKNISYVICGIGYLIQAVLILLGVTIFPRWMFFVTPLFLIFLLPIIRKLPRRLYIVICGGWTNLISVIYYLVAIFYIL